MSSLPESYELKVYAGWIGKCCGVRFGAPIENWTYDQIASHLGEIDDYLPQTPGKIFQPDDDTNVPVLMLHGVQDFGPQVSAEQLGETLLNYLGDQHGSLWWGGYGISTEHTAYLNLKAGIPAPLSGSLALNGATVAEQIGGQIFSDIWGFLNPNNPTQAAEYARRAASVTHDRNGIYGGMFIAALVSAAFSERDPRRLVQHALEVIPADSEYARLVRSLLDFHAAHPEDWRACYHYIATNFGYDRYPGIVHIIPNAGIVVMGLLYGAGDFGRSLGITNMGGWDTDCNVGNVGAIMGVAVGLEGIPSRWRDPLEDVLAAAGLPGAANLLDIPTIAAWTANLGRQIAGEPRLPRRPRAHFDYPGATHGFRHWGEQRNILVLRQQKTPQGGVLKAVVRLLKKKQDLRVYQETYWPRARLNSDYYAAGFSPTIYPGQTLRSRVWLPAEAPAALRAGLYVWDAAGGPARQGALVQGEIVPLQPGQWHDLVWRIPPLADACLTQVGVNFRNLGAETWKGEFWLDDFDWDGAPEYSFDFQHARPEYGAIAQWTFLRGYWRLQDGAYHGSGAEISETYTGDRAWSDLRLRVRLAPQWGMYHNLNLRVQGARRSYAAGLAPGGRLALYKKEGDQYRELSAVEFPWEQGQVYELELEARGYHLTLRAAGGPRLEWTDEQAPYLHGQIGLSNFPGCHTRYEAMWVSPAGSDHS